MEDVNVTKVGLGGGELSQPEPRYKSDTAFSHHFVESRYGWWTASQSVLVSRPTRGLMTRECHLRFRAETVVPTKRSWSSLRKSCGVNWFSEQSGISLVLSVAWNYKLKGP